MLTHIGTITIETERLILRRFEYSDNEAMRKYWIADEKIQSLYSVVFLIFPSGFRQAVCTNSPETSPTGKYAIFARNL